MQEVIQAMERIVQQLFGAEPSIILTRTDEQFGDYATNVALQLAKQVGKNPREVAEAIVAELKHPSVSEATVAGPGFINLKLTNQALLAMVDQPLSQDMTGKRVLVEYSCPNAFKELHTGHLYNTIAGDSLARVFEKRGATVFRANFGGDVGLHVGKALYGVLQQLEGEHPEKLAAVTNAERTTWLSNAYVAGAAAYEADEAAKQQIGALNTAVYGFHDQNDHDSPLAQIYWTCREWSYDYFKQFYSSIQVAAFDKYYPESLTTPKGREVVAAYKGTVFVESEGALIFKGEEDGLHTRVFITSKGLPTYETKDLGVIMTEVDDFAFDRRIVMTGNDQSEYMKVVFAALARIDPELATKQAHLTNGIIRFGSGKKMSSRLGNVLRAVEAMDAVREVVEANTEELKEQITLGAVKYEFLKYRLGGDIAFDPKESVSLQGNSGPYLQYAHARARSILAKATLTDVALEQLEAEERSLVRKLSEFNEVVDKAVDELMLHHICNYLYELAQVFNSFYEHNRVIDDPRQDIRLQLVSKYATVLHRGLDLLNIPAPERL